MQASQRGLPLAEKKSVDEHFEGSFGAGQVKIKVVCPGSFR